MKLRAATLCSGIGAPEHALAQYDFRFCAEIDTNANITKNRPGTYAGAVMFYPIVRLTLLHFASVNFGIVRADRLLD